MPKTKQTDNASLPDKIALRRWLLGRVGLSRVNVLDVCSGAGHVWRRMADYVEVGQWTRCDIKPREPGVLAVEAVAALLRMPLARYDVVDIDPYNEPWEPFNAFLSRFDRPTAVFLTWGRKKPRSTPTIANKAAAGIPPSWNADIPKTEPVLDWVARHALSATWNHADIALAGRVHLPNADYFGLYLHPRSPAPGIALEARS